MHDHEHFVEFVVGGAGDFNDDAANELFEVFDGAVEYGTRDALTYVGVYVSRPDWWMDVPRAIKMISSVFPAARVTRIDLQQDELAEAV